MKSILTISRKWHNPQIEVAISNEGINLKMDMADFKEALKREIGSITWTFRKETFNQMLDEAITKIISGIKEESAKVV
jgi:C-terminal processing protease CtpA/Prc